jgi:hypothetical protein
LLSADQALGPGEIGLAPFKPIPGGYNTVGGVHEEGCSSISWWMPSALLRLAAFLVRPEEILGELAAREVVEEQVRVVVVLPELAADSTSTYGTTSRRPARRPREIEGRAVYGRQPCEPNPSLVRPIRRRELDIEIEQPRHCPRARSFAACWPAESFPSAVRTFRLEFDTSTVPAINGNNEPCHVPFVAQVSAHLTQTAADYVYDPNAQCFCE